MKKNLKTPTNAERQKSHYNRNRSMGLVLFKQWIKPEHREAVKKFIQSL